ncbi:hypothetical protein K461DRAFT_229711 [Myriangium duriaei CBS 260.36]|uniref:MARVEL domain-containing protein n=1 Tax=Myriangium duriaei CBS 260.36 TaxID=1168546 RepID=A0A9P4MDF2_9PEZI|nr:hypothetical protein K461DRAFT_229711 [Myriangium duriaei CBS 260.36]
MTEPARPKTSGSGASNLSLKTKTARFAEATAVNSPSTPVGPTQFSFPQQAVVRQKPNLAPIDVNFGASIDHNMATVKRKDSLPCVGDDSNSIPSTPPPKTPFTAMPLMSPTWQEEQSLEKAQGHTDKEQVKDLKVKTRVRIAKFLLRGVNFSCSLIVLSMLSTSLTIFRTTKDIPPRFVGNQQLKPWAPKQQTWPQIVVLTISCVSLLFTMIVLWHYWRGGHRRASKTSARYTLFAIGIWIFSLIMWILGATVLHQSRVVGENQDMWGWSCVQNTRSHVFSDEIKYSLVCRLQNWSLVCCIIEVVVEAITISIYAVVAYRFWSKRRLQKSMSKRDRARSDLYLAQLKSQPNTPAWPLDHKEQFEQDIPMATVRDNHPQPFVLQPAPASRVTSPSMGQTGFAPVALRGAENIGVAEEMRPTSPRGEVRATHVAAAPGEQTYDEVPVPRAYGE